MDDEKLFDELLHRLNLGDDSAEYSPGQDGILLYRFRGYDHDPPFVLHVDARTLGEHLRAMEDLQELFPEDAPEIAALQLFLVRVIETVDIVLSGVGPWRSDHHHLVPVHHGVRSQNEAP